MTFGYADSALQTDPFTLSQLKWGKADAWMSSVLSLIAIALFLTLSTAAAVFVFVVVVFISFVCPFWLIWIQRYKKCVFVDLLFGFSTMNISRTRLIKVKFTVHGTKRD